MFRKGLGWVIGVIFMAGCVGSVYAADMKIACVDIQRAVNECQAGKDAKAAMIKEMEKFQKSVADKQKELQTQKESIEKQAPMLKPDARASKEKEYQNKLRDFQRWGEDTQNELKQKQAEMERNILTGLLRVIKKLGEDDAYHLILEKNENFVLFAAKAIEITDRVIKAHDAQKK
jgi:outer membrane protein